MAKLYTRTGDDGRTSLFDGSRVPKDDLRVQAYGDVDDLNAHVGSALALIQKDHPGPGWTDLADRLIQVQNELFALGAELATPAEASAAKHQRVPHMSEEHSKRLEGWIDDASSAVPPLRNFVLPGGTLAAANLHICRTICRKAERSAVTLAGASAINPQAIIYLNRLSDLLFAWARYVNHLQGIADIPWKGG